MQIDHIALYTRDLGVCGILHQIFLMVRRASCTRTRRPHAGVLVSLADGARLEIVTRPQFEDAEHSRLWTGWAHDRSRRAPANVDALTEQMRSEWP